MPLPDPPADDDQAELTGDFDVAVDSGRELARRQIDPPGVAM